MLVTSRDGLDPFVSLMFCSFFSLPPLVFADRDGAVRGLGRDSGRKAEGGAPSRGLPGEAKMSEQIYRSQLEELAELKTEMQKLVAVTR